MSASLGGKFLTAEEFLHKELPPKEPLVDGLLYRRDIVAFAGRRRHGKTTFLLSLGTSMSSSEPEFLGYSISKPRRVAMFFLEDDAREIQDKLRGLNSLSYDGRLVIQTRDDFFQGGIPIDVADSSFRERVEETCSQHGADLLVLDNLAHLIGGNYNESTRIHQVGSFAWQLTSRFNCAVIIAAHPRKKGKKGDFLNPRVTLRNDPEDFFEEVMGSSHFVNSCGSLWGIERNIQTNRSDFLGGTQRLTGEHRVVLLERGDDGRFQLVTDDFNESLSLALNTPARQAAWKRLPQGRFTYSEAERAVVPVAMKSKSTFHEWFSDLRRRGLVLPDGDGYVHI